jgi:hypothetical protein
VGNLDHFSITMLAYRGLTDHEFAPKHGRKVPKFGRDASKAKFVKQPNALPNNQ